MDGDFYTISHLDKILVQQVGQVEPPKFSIPFKGYFDTAHFAPFPNIRIPNIHYAFLRVEDPLLRTKEENYPLLLACTLKILTRDASSAGRWLTNSKMIFLDLTAENEQTQNQSREGLFLYPHLYVGKELPDDHNWVFGTAANGMIFRMHPEELVEGIIDQFPDSPLAIPWRIKKNMFPGDLLPLNSKNVDLQARIKEYMINEKVSEAWGRQIHATVLMTAQNGVNNIGVTYRHAIGEWLKKLSTPEIEAADRVSNRLTPPSRKPPVPATAIPPQSLQF